ncbi:MAG: FAD-binding domain-containing protein [Pseudomonadota bacterium]
MIEFAPTRTAALERLSDFAPHAGRDYASLRNYDLGHEGHPHVSTLSPYVRHRALTEGEVLDAVLGRFSLSSAEKFVQEVYWRTYWKGWLQLRRPVWRQYTDGVHRAWNEVQTQGGLRREWEAACKGETGIDGFDAWARELVDTGYLHNHARMWLASIWIFTLRLPWELGADFFLRHLLDGDPASNTLSWRWVAGLQTQGKTYLARTSNIAKYTRERFRPTHQLATEAPALAGAPHPDRQPFHPGGTPDADKPTVLILHEDDLSPGYVLDKVEVTATAVVTNADRRSPLDVSPGVKDFTRDLTQDAVDRYGPRLGSVSWIDAGDVQGFAADHGATQIVSPYAPEGWVSDALNDAHGDISVVPVLRDYDAQAWPYATAGFFKFKSAIPKLVAARKGLQAA